MLLTRFIQHNLRASSYIFTCFFARHLPLAICKPTINVVFFATWKYLLSSECSFMRQLLWFYYQGNSCRFFWISQLFVYWIKPIYVCIYVFGSVVCQFLSKACILIKFHFFPADVAKFALQQVWLYGGLASKMNTKAAIFWR